MLKTKINLYSKPFSNDCIAQWYVFGFVIQRSMARAQPKFYTFLVISNFFFNFGLTFGIASSNPGQNWHFFNSRQQSWDHFIWVQSIKLYMSYKGQVPQSTGNSSKIKFLVCFHSKMGSQNRKKSIFSKRLVRIQKY